MNWSNEGDGDF